MLYTTLGFLSSFRVLVFLMPVVSACLGALLKYLTDPDMAGRRSCQGFVCYCLPRELFSRATVTDILYVACDKVLAPFTIVPFLFSAAAIADFTSSVLSRAVAPSPAWSTPGWALALFTVANVLLTDFAIFIVHVAFHKVPVLWEFHKVHHSATVMTPVTMRRQHPVDVVAQYAAMSVLGGALAGVYLYLFGSIFEEVMIAGINWFVFLNTVTFSYLKHSPIHLRFRGIWGFLFVSPAGHQLHHSNEIRYWDINYGQNFLIWDRLCGTYVVPPINRTYTLGLSQNEHEEYDRVYKLFLLPFVKAWRKVKGQKAVLVSDERTA